MRIKIIVIISAIFCFTFGQAWGVASFAQNVGINTTGNAPNSSALLDINASPSNDKGILIPRLPLTSTNSGAPISPLPGVGETGLMVYNTATAGVPPNDVVPGFYYWNGTAWAPLGAGGSTAGGWTDDGTVVRLTTSTDFVGIGTASPASTSALDISSTTKGILIPRMTTAQRDAIVSPATGLQVYNTDCKVLNYWSGTCWISTSKAINDPDAISSSGTTVFCAGQVRTYTIAAVTGATYYNWSVPAGTVITSGQGTTSISATFGNISGSVCVKARNACETSGQTCLAVSVDPIPNTPGNITGPSSINPGQQSVNYFIASVNGASAYTWAYSGTGLSIASGTGTTSIVVNFACNATAGNLTVTANSTCGASTASSLALTVTPLLAVSAGSPVFGGTTQTIGNAATGGTAGYTYSWLPNTDISNNLIANPIAQCTGSTTTYAVTVTDSRSCTATSSVVVTRNLAVNAGSGVFGGVSQTIGNAATGGAGSYTYAWTPNPNNLSSYTIATPIAQCTGSTTTYTVTATDANSCIATSSVVVTRSLTASAGGGVAYCNVIGGSPTATGGQTGYTYSWSPTTNLSSSTASNPIASPATTTTYTVTVTDAQSCTALSSGVTVSVAAPPLSASPANISYTGALQTFIVPCGITSIQIEVWGAQGTTKGANLGGKGGYSKGNLVVTSGQVLNIYVGGQSGTVAGGFNGGGTGVVSGGGGGGGTDVRVGGTALANRVIVAGGGGGATTSWTTTGGTGGGTNGGAGISSNGGSHIGQGGTQAAGGAVATAYGTGTAGSLGLGGNGSTNNSDDPGGGGGYYGGGGGAAGGAGGGSGYIGGVTGGTMSNGLQSGSGTVVITY